MSWALWDTDGFTSYKVANSDTGGNAYPDAPASSYTITGLAPGEYAVFVRSRYDDYRNGPFKKSAKVTVASSTPAEPRSEPTPEATVEPTPEATVEPTPEATVEATAEPTPEPGAITGLTMTSDRPGHLWVSWDEASPAPTEYRLNWAPVDESFPAWNSNEGGNLWLPSRTAQDFSNLVEAGVTYKLQMRAIYKTGPNAPWSGPWSAETTKRVRNNPPGAPTGLSVVSATQDGVALSWSAPGHNGLTGYRILRGSDADTLGTIVEDTGNLDVTYTDTTAADDATHHYAVVALSLDGDSPRSGTASATTPPRTTDDTSKLDDTSRREPTSTPEATETPTPTPEATETPTPEPLSNDASLKTLGVGDLVLTPAFASSLIFYSASADAESLTLLPEATDDGAVVAIDPEDADTGVAGHQVTLSNGDNVITITVTAEDGTTSKTYTLAVAREALISEPQTVLENVSEPVGEDFPADSTTTGRVLVGGSVTGTIDRHGDRDWFAVHLEVGKRYIFDLKRGGTWDPIIAKIVNSAGATQPNTFNDDFGFEKNRLGNENSRVYLEPVTEGTYYVEATSEEPRRSGRLYNGVYTLEVAETSEEDLPADSTTGATVALEGDYSSVIEHSGDVDWVKFEVAAGKHYRLQMVRADSGTEGLEYPSISSVMDAAGVALPALRDGGTGFGHYNASTVYVVAPSTGTYSVVLASRSVYQPPRFQDQNATGKYTLRFREETSPDVPAGSGTAASVDVGGSYTGKVDYAHDEDWIEMVLDAGKTYRIDLEGRISHGWPCLWHPVINRIVNDSGDTQLNTYNKRGGESYNSLLFWTPSETGTYYLEAKANPNWPWLNGNYKLFVRLDDYSENSPLDVSVGHVIDGEISPYDDRDWFSVALEADVQYRFKMLGADDRLGTLVGPVLDRLINESGEAQQASYAYGNGRTYSLATFTPSTSGTYRIRASGAKKRPSGRPNHYHGLIPSGTYKFLVYAISDIYPTDNTTPGRVTVDGTSLIATSAQVGDVDWIGVELEAGKSYRVETLSCHDSELADACEPRVSKVVDGSGNQVAGSYGERVVRMDPVSTGLHFIEVKQANASSGNPYGVRVRLQDDDFVANTTDHRPVDGWRVGGSWGDSLQAVGSGSGQGLVCD